MKKYFVSLAAKVPCNVEMELEAKSEKEVFEIALGLAEEKIGNGEISDPFWSEVELDLGEKSKYDEFTEGVHIEEI